MQLALSRVLASDGISPWPGMDSVSNMVSPETCPSTPSGPAAEPASCLNPSSRRQAVLLSPCPRGAGAGAKTGFAEAETREQDISFPLAAISQSAAATPVASTAAAVPTTAGMASAPGPASWIAARAWALTRASAPGIQASAPLLARSLPKEPLTPSVMLSILVMTSAPPAQRSAWRRSSDCNLSASRSTVCDMKLARCSGCSPRERASKTH
mmetsp:Transcript_70655/g.151392  ORF Transcript_70655/g.151392 Transcript_70655/m.151392 type:complete len:212 (+) Transcript_70655:181-816(+)